MLPHLDITMEETVAKKLIFQEHCISTFQIYITSVITPFLWQNMEGDEPKEGFQANLHLTLSI